jgi:hypothetical protein
LVPRSARSSIWAARRPTRAEFEKTGRRGFQEAPRVTLRRAVSTAAAGAASEQEFFARLYRAGVLVRERFSTRNPGEITGYAVALPHDATAAGRPVWFGGGKLAADLTLPKLRSRWNVTGPRPADRFTTTERNEIWEHAARTAAGAAEYIRNLTATDTAEAADAAWATADTLHAAAAALGSRTLRQAADSYDRAARAPYGRIPDLAQPGISLRRAARLLSTAMSHSGDPALTQMTLITRFVRLVEAVADLREAQQRAAQAAAARQAADRLYTAISGHSAPAARKHARTQATAVHSNVEFPFRPGTARPESDLLNSARGTSRSGAGPSHSQGTPSQRGLSK